MTTAVEPAVKACSKCRTTKPTSEFNSDSSRSNGLSAWCRDCNRAANRAYRAARKPQHDKQCARCGYGMPYSAFPVNPSRPDGHGEWCTDCHTHEAQRTRNAILVRRYQRAQAAAAEAEEARRRAYDETELGVAWQKRAACKPGSANAFFPETSDPGASEYAQEICRRCPVADLCAADAARSKQRTGVWAGASREPRKRKASA